jgi:deoxyribose-phosphate aldolase
VVALVGFPLGAMDPDAKRFELETAIDHGAQEIELVFNLGRLKDGDARYVLRELRDLAEAAEERPVCVALETARLTREEIVTACHLALDSGVTAVSNTTGFWGEAPPSMEEIRFLRETVGARFGLKAALIPDEAAAQAALQAGATRLGLRYPVH